MKEIEVKCESCGGPIYVGDRILEIVKAGTWYNGHTSIGQLVHFSCVDNREKD